MRAKQVSRFFMVLLLVAVVAVNLLVIFYMVWPRPLRWSPAEMETLRSLWIGSLPSLPPDPSNAVAGEPRAVALGHRLFFDTRFSANGQVACATCHRPERMFVDGLPRGKGIGTTPRKTMTIIGIAYSPWFFWDGRKDSQWAQALGPMENPIEHGGTRTQYAHLIAETYHTEYEALFGPLPDLSDRARFPDTAGPMAGQDARSAWEQMTPADREVVTRIYVNIGKSIAAYERQIMPGPSRFDTYVQTLLAGDTQATQSALTPTELAGLRLFMGKAKCIQCHNGPLFTNNSFHNTGVPAAAGLPPDTGRAAGAPQVLADEFNCLSRYSDAEPEACAELRFVNEGDRTLAGAFKPPTLRNVAETAPYMHAGQFATLRQVVAHYNRAAPGPVGKSELSPLRLPPKELAQLEAFLKTLSGPLAVPSELLAPPAN